MVYNYEGGLKAVWDGKGTTLSGILPSTMTCQPTLSGYAYNLSRGQDAAEPGGRHDADLALPARAG